MLVVATLSLFIKGTFHVGDARYVLLYSTLVLLGLFSFGAGFSIGKYKHSSPRLDFR